MDELHTGDQTKTPVDSVLLVPDLGFLPDSELVKLLNRNSLLGEPYLLLGGLILAAMLLGFNWTVGKL